MWYTTLGATITILVSIVSTIVFGRNNPKDVPQELMAPFVRKIVFKEKWKGNDKRVSSFLVISEFPSQFDDFSMFFIVFNQFIIKVQDFTLTF